MPVAPANWSCDNPAPYWDAGEELWYLTCRTKKHGMRTATHLEGPWVQIGDQPYANFDIILAHLSRISQLHATQHTPCAILYLVAMPIGC